MVDSTQSARKHSLWRFCVAPMMQYTDRHFRMLARIMSAKARLYTEMVVCDALLYGDPDRFLRHSPDEHPVALQLGEEDIEVGLRRVATEGPRVLTDSLQPLRQLALRFEVGGRAARRVARARPGRARGARPGPHRRCSITPPKPPPLPPAATGRCGPAAGRRRRRIDREVPQVNKKKEDGRKKTKRKAKKKKKKARPRSLVRISAASSGHPWACRLRPS